MLANGRRDYFERSLAAFCEHVSPAPAHAFLMDDGGELGDEELITGTPWNWTVETTPSRLGSCDAYKSCWGAAATSDYDWVFHLEEDQVIVRPTHLPDLARILELEPHIALMTLVRAPWGREIEFGGYIPQFPGLYERKAEHGAEWIETVRNWAMAPSLFRTDLTREFPWPARAGCETTIGPQIIARRPEAVFGLWGGGEPHCAHIGVNKAVGAHGY